MFELSHRSLEGVGALAQDAILRRVNIALARARRAVVAAVVARARLGDGERGHERSQPTNGVKRGVDVGVRASGRGRGEGFEGIGRGDDFARGARGDVAHDDGAHGCEDVEAVLI